MKNDKARRKTRIAVYLIGKKNDTFLLGKRISNHMNDHWSLPAGHVYEGESCSKAIIREISEECGITLKNEDIELTGAMHHYSAPFDYSNYIFTADLSNYKPINTEPNKCSELKFFSINKLPNTIVPYTEFMLNKTISNDYKPWIAEYGW